MKRHTEKTRTQLGALHALGAKTEAAERKILAAAEKRHAEVVAMIDRSRPGVESAAEDAQQRYTALIAEKGHLDVVISKAKSALAM